MISSTWLEHRRDDDDELTGYLAPAGDGLHIPMTLFGSPLTGPRPADDAAAVLDSHGLASLADPWMLDRPGSEPLRVRIAEVTPARVVVGEETPYLTVDLAAAITLAVPAGDQLRPLRPIRAP